MPLPAGACLGLYEIRAPAGAGGMGEVYRARDTRLDRDVAAQVLPSHAPASAPTPLFALAGKLWISVDVRTASVSSPSSRRWSATSSRSR